MEEYFILFHESGTIIIPDDTENGKLFTFNEGEALKVNRATMFKWVELHHINHLSFSIYQANLICDIH